MTQERLYNLLPRIYRREDLKKGQSLRALMAVLESQYDSLEQDIRNLYDNWFIETCAPWCIPYIGDLLGVTGLTAGKEFPGSWRALVANTIHNRRRKGTTAVIADAAREATGWYSLAVEFFENLAVSQSLKHIRPHKGKTFNLKNKKLIDDLDTPFDTAAHTVDIRSVPGNRWNPSPVSGSCRGKYNIPNIGIFLWRLQSFPLTLVDAWKVNEGYYTFNPLGIDTPLFNLPETPVKNLPETTTRNLPVSLKRGDPHFTDMAIRLKHHPVFRIFVKNDDFSTSSTGLELETGDRPVNRNNYKEKFRQTLLRNRDEENDRGDYFELHPAALRICDLEQWRVPTEFLYNDSVFAVIDPELGRLVFLHDLQPAGVKVDYCYGFSGSIGGGPYSRVLSQEDEEPLLTSQKKEEGETPRTAVVSSFFSADEEDDPENLSEQGGNSRFKSLNAALNAWYNSGKQGIIRILDSSSYDKPGTYRSHVENTGFHIDLQGEEWLILETADSQCPSIIGNIEVNGTGSACTVVLKGLWIDGTITVSGNVDLKLSHCTFKPQKGSHPGKPVDPAIQARKENCRDIRIMLSHCICGPLRLPAGINLLQIDSSIIDGLGEYAISAPPQKDSANTSRLFGPPAIINKSTILGAISLSQLRAANDVLFAAPVWVKDCNQGYVRFSNVPLDSNTPIMYQCLNRYNREEICSFFTSIHYGRPGYGQLSAQCPAGIGTGAENGSQMGAFNFLFYPQREANLKDVLKEYFPTGLKAEVFYVT